MRPIIKRVKNEFEDCRVIYVADRGLNTSDNIYKINGDNKGDNNERDGYVYGQSVRGADEEFKKWVLGGGYRNDVVIDYDGKEVTFRHKWIFRSSSAPFPENQSTYFRLFRAGVSDT